MGPWQFNTGASAQVVNPRLSRPRPYSRADGKDWDRLPLVRTRPDRWMTGMSQATWDHDHSGPLRLKLTCRRGDDEPWILTREIKVQGLGTLPSPADAGRSLLPPHPS